MKEKILNINWQDYSQPAAVMFVVAVMVTIARYRDWFWPEGLTLKDRTPDPRAGTFNAGKALADFIFVPTIVVIGCIIMGLGFNMALAVAAVVFCAFVGSAWLAAAVTGARDKVIDAIAERIKGWGK